MADAGPTLGSLLRDVIGAAGITTMDLTYACWVAGYGPTYDIAAAGVGRLLSTGEANPKLVTAVLDACNAPDVDRTMIAQLLRRDSEAQHEYYRSAK